MHIRTPFIAGNWKMFKTCTEAVDTAKQLASLVKPTEAVDVMIAPPFTALAPVFEALKGSAVSLGAQNMHWENQGAYTGDVSAPMLAIVQVINPLA